METKHTKVSVQDKILQRIMNKCWYEDDGSAAVYYDIVELAVTKEVSELAKERDDLLEALIEAKKVILSLNPTSATEEQMNEYAVKGGVWDKIITAINKATK